MAVRIQGALVIAAIGCGTPARPVASREPIVAPSDPAVPRDAAVSALVHVDGQRRTIEAPHGGVIRRLAVTADGTAALTEDELGGIRLWPTLDGTVEPRLVDLPPTRGLAIAPEPRGFVAAAVDQVGGLVIQVIDRNGIAVQRASLRADPAHLGIEMTSRGVLAWRADQMIVRFTTDGTLSAQLPLEAGQQIVSLAVAGDRAVAVIGTENKQRARWLTLGDALAWGAWVDAGDEVGGVIAVSPSGKRFASARHLKAQGTPQVVVIDTATGHVIANETVSVAGSLGFLDDDHLAVSMLGSVQWLDLTKQTGATAPLAGMTTDLPESGTMTVAGGRAISIVNSELLITTPSSVSYLGYDLETPAVAAPGPNGQLLVGVRESFALLDPNLDAAALPSLGVPATAAVSELRWVGGTTWLVEWSQLTDGQTSLAVVDIASKKPPKTLRSGMPMVGLLLYEPSTKLVTLSLGAAPEVAAFDPARLTLDALAVLPKPASYRQIELVPVTPALAGGTKVVVIEMLDTMTMRWVRDPKNLAHGPSITIQGSLGAADRAGHVYVWRSTPTGLELAIYRDGTWIGVLPTGGPVAVWPSPTGSHIVLISANRVSLVARDGTNVWTQPIQGASEALWIDDTTIAILGAGGLARFDAMTGKLLAARCGWRFGLSLKPHPVSAHVEPMCAQLR